MARVRGPKKENNFDLQANTFADIIKQIRDYFSTIS
jgi:hypothetical protein